MENQPQAKSSNTGRNILIAIIVLLLGLNGVLGYLYLKEKDKVEVQTVTIERLDEERINLKAELEDIIEEYDMMETDNEEMQAELDSARAVVEELLAQVEKHKDDAWQIARLKKEAASLREIMKGYLVTIDSLNTLNIALREEKAIVENERDQHRERAQSLSAEKADLEETVKLGSRLRALDVMAVAQRVKSNGVHRETTRAARAEKVKCCFTIDVNEIAAAGQRRVYMRVIDPNGDVLCLEQDETNMFEYNGVEGLYTTYKVVDYQNEELDVCMYWEVVKELPVGTYVVELFADELDIGTGSFVLK